MIRLSLIAAWLGRVIAAMAYGTRATVPTRRVLIEPVSVLRDE
jgi:hypothetical protein